VLRRAYTPAQVAEAEINRIFILDGLRAAVKALAAGGDAALALSPEGTVKADELALDFDNFKRAALEGLESELTQAQRESLLDVDRLLAAMSEARQADLWTEEGVRTHPKWQEVREAAKRVLVEFGWDDGPPNPKRGFVDYGTR
jgi:hypothetical protein